MVAIDDIKDRESFKAWLDDLPKEHVYPVAVALAARAAWRAVPYWHWFFDNAGKKSEAPPFALALFRCALTSTFAPISPNADVKAAAAAAPPRRRRRRFLVCSS